MAANLKTYKIDGMDCAHCAQTITNGVSKFPGVSNVEVDFVGGTLKFSGEVADDALRERVSALGYKVVDDEPVGAGLKPAPTHENAIIAFARYLLRETNTRLAVIGGGLIVVGVIASLFSEPLATMLFVAATLIALYPLARSGINNLRINHDFNINLLMTIAAIGALAIGETLEGATVVFLFAVGEALEGFTTDRARQSIRSLMTLVPATATKLYDGQHELTIPVTDLAVGDLILVKAGERLPADGVIAAGESGIDQAPITGESVPVAKQAGDTVFAGTINGSGALEINVTHTTADNTISRIIRMVEEAQSARAPSQRIVDRIARVYTPAITVVALLVALVPPLLFNAPFYDVGRRAWLAVSRAVAAGDRLPLCAGDQHAGDRHQRDHGGGTARRPDQGRRLSRSAGGGQSLRL